MLFASHFLRDSCCSEFKGETWAVGIVRSVLPLRPRGPLAPYTCLHLRLLWHLLLSRILALVPLLPCLSLTSAGGFFCIWMSSGISQMKPYEPTLSLCPSVPYHPAPYVSSSETKQFEDILHTPCPCFLLSCVSVPAWIPFSPFLLQMLFPKTRPASCYQWYFIAHVFILFLMQLNISSHFLLISHLSLCCLLETFAYFLVMVDPFLLNFLMGESRWYPHSLTSLQ